MHDFNLHSQTVRGYAVAAPAKSGVGIGVPEQLSAISDAPASFLSSASTHTQIMVGWIGAPKGAPVSDNAGYANPVQFTTSEIGVNLQNSANIRLPFTTAGRYAFSVAAKSVTGRENPFYFKATQTRPASFFVSCHRAPIFSGNARNVSMVALVGLPKGRPVPLKAGILTPANVTTPLERENSGGDSLNFKEAAVMVATPTQTHPEFTFHFLAVRRSDLNDRPHRETITAPDELTARRLLAGRFVLCFAGRVPSQEVRHA